MGEILKIFGIASLLVTLGSMAQLARADQKENTSTENGGVALSQEENQLAIQIHHINQMEVAAGTQASQKGTSSSIRAYGDRLVRDHQAADHKLILLVGSAALNPSAKSATSPEDLDGAAHDAAFMQNLKALSGAQFDEVYLTGMVDGHQQAIQLLTQSLAKLPEPSNLRDYIVQLIPILKQHEQLATQLRSGLHTAD